MPKTEIEGECCDCHSYNASTTVSGSCSRPIEPGNPNSEYTKEYDIPPNRPSCAIFDPIHYYKRGWWAALASFQKWWQENRMYELPDYGKVDKELLKRMGENPK